MSTTFIRPLFVSRGSALPLLLVLIGILGGAIAFGFIGIFLGPTILAILYTVDAGMEPRRVPSAAGRRRGPHQTKEFRKNELNARQRLCYLSVITMASPPRFSINPVRLASRWMMTPSGLFSQHLAGAGGTGHRAVADLAVGAGKIGKACQSVERRRWPGWSRRRCRRCRARRRRRGTPSPL